MYVMYAVQLLYNVHSFTFTALYSFSWCTAVYTYSLCTLYYVLVQCTTVHSAQRVDGCAGNSLVHYQRPQISHSTRSLTHWRSIPINQSFDYTTHSLALRPINQSVQQCIYSLAFNHYNQSFASSARSFAAIHC